MSQEFDHFFCDFMNAAFGYKIPAPKFLATDWTALPAKTVESDSNHFQVAGLFDIRAWATKRSDAADAARWDQQQTWAAEIAEEASEKRQIKNQTERLSQAHQKRLAEALLHIQDVEKDNAMLEEELKSMQYELSKHKFNSEQDQGYENLNKNRKNNKRNAVGTFQQRGTSIAQRNIETKSSRTTNNGRDLAA